MAKGQSALEYMMTYGWAILIIVIVAISNFKLSSENMEKIKSKIEQYLKKLDSLFKTSILYGVKQKY